MRLVPPVQQLTRGRSILVADADIVECELICRPIRDAGLTVTVVHDGAAAWTRTLEHEFSGIVLTMGLPELDGFSLLRKIRRNKRTPSLLLAECYEDCIEGLDAGADDFLMNPFAPAELLARIVKMLRNPTWKTVVVANRTA
jgi:two-component system, OmpR family, response regulator MtrA